MGYPSQTADALAATLTGHLPAWHDDAACQDTDPEIFYYPDNERGKAREMRERAAKTVCNTCPVKQQCLEWAIDTNDGFAIMGGTTPEERGIRGHNRLDQQAS